MATRLILQNVRTSFCNVWRPKSINGGAEKYSCVFLIAKEDKDTLTKVKATEAEIEKDAIGKYGTSFTKGKFSRLLKDGDAKDPSDENYAGYYYINATSVDKPYVVDSKLQPILDATEVYSGCYVNASVNVSAFNNQANKGITCFLNGVQKVSDGEPFGARRSRPEEDFSVIDDDDFLS